ncbi:hypothetical protein QBE52_04060 [Clostridiaceae bacterium 35-E11]
MHLCYISTDVGDEMSQIEKMSFILDAVHYNLIFIFLSDVTGSLYVSQTENE